MDDDSALPLPPAPEDADPEAIHHEPKVAKFATDENMKAGFQDWGV